MDHLLFWPPPDDAASGCFYNIAKVDKKEQLIADQMTKRTVKMTSLNQMFSVDVINESGQACLCCAKSAIFSTYLASSFVSLPAQC